jgi:hypothetical protein
VTGEQAAGVKYMQPPPAKENKKRIDVDGWDLNPRSPHSTNTYELSFGMLTTTLPTMEYRCDILNLELTLALVTHTR